MGRRRDYQPVPVEAAYSLTRFTAGRMAAMVGNARHYIADRGQIVGSGRYHAVLLAAGWANMDEIWHDSDVATGSYYVRTWWQVDTARDYPLTIEWRVTTADNAGANSSTTTTREVLHPSDRGHRGGTVLLSYPDPVYREHREALSATLRHEPAATLSYLRRRLLIEARMISGPNDGVVSYRGCVAWNALEEGDV